MSLEIEPCLSLAGCGGARGAHVPDADRQVGAARRARGRRGAPPPPAAAARPPAPHAAEGEAADDDGDDGRDSSGEGPPLESGVNTLTYIKNKRGANTLPCGTPRKLVEKSVY